MPAQPEAALAFRVRRARPNDLDGIMRVEEAAFDPARRAGRTSLQRSLHSPMQSAWVMRAPGDGRVAAFLILWHSKHSVRVYDIAVDPGQQGRGLGRRLMTHAEAVARQRGAKRVLLEADARDRRLLAFYEQLGYARTRELPDYYGPRRHGARFEKQLV